MSIRVPRKMLCKSKHCIACFIPSSVGLASCFGWILHFAILALYYVYLHTPRLHPLSWLHRQTPFAHPPPGDRRPLGPCLLVQGCGVAPLYPTPGCPRRAGNGSFVS